MKYIVMDLTDIILFPRRINHAEMAKQNGGIDKCTSAGFVGLNHEGQFCCYGESESLGKKATDFDNAVLRQGIKEIGSL